jgi:hypothetical protein
MLEIYVEGRMFPVLIGGPGRCVSGGWLLNTEDVK